MLEKAEEIKKGLIAPETFCDHCSYNGEPNGCNHPDGMCQAWTSADDAYELIQQLEERVPKWISVEERLPEEGQEVLVSVNGGFCISHIFDFDMMTGEPEWTYTGLGADPDHWMPLPEGPKEG